MTTKTVSAPTERPLRDVIEELAAIRAEAEAIIATYPPDHPARLELARQKRQAPVTSRTRSKVGA